MTHENQIENTQSPRLDPTACFELHNISLTLPSLSGDVPILRQISLTSKRGESLAIIGPSGAGKSSLLMILGGIERASSGKIIINGRDITHLSESRLAVWRRQEIGVVFQSFRLIGSLTALENVALPLQLAGIDHAHDRASAALTDLGLASRLTHFPEQLSGGEQQRVALARAWVGQPKILLADEPTGNLDSKNGGLVMEMLLNWQKNNSQAGENSPQGQQKQQSEHSQQPPHMNRNLVLVTHDASLAARCDRVINITDGQITQDSLHN